MKTKVCSKCKKKLPLTADYFFRNKCRKSGFSCACKKCKSIYVKARQQTSAGRRTKRKGKLKLKFNLTLEQYDKMFEQQNGICATCGQIDITGRRLAVDHDHKTGKVRGLLCANCNLLLGRLENAPGLFSKMVKYLKMYDSARLL